MRVYVVMANNELMSICGDEQTAKWEKEMIELGGEQKVVIKECGVVSYDEGIYQNPELLEAAE
ncbi:hypothetical protein [Bacillus glycinifermentans]|uniref:hypothetical protein n=1 Tax=Bacillus glycinifermentans TaxID=1664069 RepID=UPI000BC32A71|nr:hypothetical protein [Bacillus glycinifermentans]ATH91671.1 hypothetical protein COP00_02825 [Bacillus glycinifermentans]